MAHLTHSRMCHAARLTATVEAEGFRFDAISKVIDQNAVGRNNGSAVSGNFDTELVEHFFQVHDVMQYSCTVQGLLRLL